MTPNEFFSLGMLFFMNYVDRCWKVDPDYLPTSLVRAFMVAVEAGNKIEPGQTAMGTSMDGDKSKDSIDVAYAIVVTKSEIGFEIIEIRDLVNDVVVPPHFVLVIFNLQMLLDRHQGDLVHASIAVDALNNCFERPKFVALLDQWPIARDNFVKMMKEGKVYFPPASEEEKAKIKKALCSITPETAWEDYLPELRSMIASYILADEEGAEKDGKIVISTTHDHTMTKLSVFRLATSIFLKMDDFMKAKLR